MDMLETVNLLIIVLIISFIFPFLGKSSNSNVIQLKDAKWIGSKFKQIYLIAKGFQILGFTRIILGDENLLPRKKFDLEDQEMRCQACSQNWVNLLLFVDHRL